MTLLQSGATWLARQLKRCAAIWVFYERKGESCVLLATQGATLWETIDAGGLPLRCMSVDWRLTAADLVLGGLPATPEAGDRILNRNGEYRNGEQPLTYEVMPPDQKNCFERLPQGIELIAYSKQILSE